MKQKKHGWVSYGFGLAVAGLFVLSGTGIRAQAKTDAPPEKTCARSKSKKKNAKQPLYCWSGTVNSLNVKKRTLVVTMGKGKKTRKVSLRICPKARVQIEGKPGKLSAVKPGAKVRLCVIKAQKHTLLTVALTVGKGKCPHMSAGCPAHCPHRAECKDACLPTTDESPVSP